MYYMNYKMLLLAHDVFYNYENRANHYDDFMAKKNPELWNKPDLSDEEVDNLFYFIIRWDRFFTGQKDLFKEAYRDNFEEIHYLNGITFYDLDLEEKMTKKYIRNIFNAFATCNRSGQYESTDASKLAHAMNPDLFIMWDSSIREGLFGLKDEKSAEKYIFEFLPFMKTELQELLASCMEGNNSSEREALGLLETITGNSVPKLIDQYNYMTYTMRTMFGSYLGNISDEEKELMSKPFSESIQYWKEKVPMRNHKYRKRTKRFVEVINELRRLGSITAKERREYNEMWRKHPEDRAYWFNEVTQLLKNTDNSLHTSLYVYSTYLN